MSGTAPGPSGPTDPHTDQLASLGIKDDSSEDYDYAPEEEEHTEPPRDPPRYRPPPHRETTALPRPSRPSGRAKIIPCSKAPILQSESHYKAWKSRFLNFLFSIDPLYRRILEERSMGNASHEEQLFNSISYAVGELAEALEIVSMLDQTDVPSKGTQAWKFLMQRYDRPTESKVQLLLNNHRKSQGPTESMAAYLQRFQVQHMELKKVGHPHTERTTVTYMLMGLRNEFEYIKHHFRVYKQSMDSLHEAVDICLDL